MSEDESVGDGGVPPAAKRSHRRSITDSATAGSTSTVVKETQQSPRTKMKRSTSAMIALNMSKTNDGGETPGETLISPGDQNVPMTRKGSISMHSSLPKLFEKEMESGHRTCHFGKEMSKNETFRCNRIVTSKFTALSLVPKSLMEQFKRLANVYFLIVSLLQVSTNLSSSSRFATLFPLICVLTIAVIREKLEDDVSANEVHA